MYPTEMTATASIPIPKYRRRYSSLSPLSSSPIVEPIVPPPLTVNGYAHLCFSQDGSWFEGHLITNDESQYGLVGRIRHLTPNNSWSSSSSSSTQSVENPMDSDESDVVTSQKGSRHNLLTVNGETSTTSPSFVSYSVSVLDHDDEESYDFNAVVLTSFDSLCSLVSPRFSFTADKSYRGQKADMLIQRYMTPRLVGNNLKVYAGNLTAILSNRSSEERDLKPGSCPMWCL